MPRCTLGLHQLLRCFSSKISKRPRSLSLQPHTPGDFDWRLLPRFLDPAPFLNISNGFFPSRPVPKFRFLGHILSNVSGSIYQDNRRTILRNEEERRTASISKIIPEKNGL